MPDRLPLEYHKRDHFSISTLVSFARCPRRYFYQKAGLAEVEEPIAPLYGKALHNAVPIALTTCDLDAAMAAFMSVWDEYETQLALGKREFDKKRNARCAERSLKHFIFTHKDGKSLYTLIPCPTSSVKTDDKTSDFEVAWAIDIDLPIPLEGRFDGLCKHRDSGKTYVWELKSTSYALGSRFFDAHELYPQNITYCLAARTLIPETIEGVMVEGMKVDATKVENLAWPILVQDHHLHDMVLWLKTTGQALLDCEAAMHDPLDAAPFIKNFTGCTPYPWFYNPGFRCEFDPMCQVADWKSLSGMYRIRPQHRSLMEVTVDKS